MKPLSLRSRITLLLMAAIFSVLGTAAWIIDKRVDHELHRRFDATLLARARGIAELTRLERDGIVFDDASDLASNDPLLGGGVVYQMDCGSRQSRVRSPALGDVAMPWPANVDEAVRYFNLNGSVAGALRAVAFRFTPELGESWGPNAASRSAHYRQAQGQTPEPSCRLLFAQPRNTIDQLTSALDALLLGSIAVAVLVVLALSPWLVKQGLRPLTALAEQMPRIGPDQPGRRLRAETPAELAPLTARFNDVLARMDYGLAREREFAQGLAHELRTRLAEHRTLLEVEQQFPGSRPLPEILSELDQIGRELEGTVTGLLLLTRLEAGLEQPRLETVDLQAMLNRMQERQLPRMHERQVALACTITDAPQLRSDGTLLEIVLGNLISNAVEYAPPGARMHVECDRNGFRICNPAPQLESADVAQLGQRFWRKGGDSRRHAGLGLALVGAASHALSMSLTFALSDNGDLCASLDWSAQVLEARI